MPPLPLTKPRPLEKVNACKFISDSKHLEMPKADDQMQFQMLLEAARNFATGRGLKLTKDSHDGLMIFNREVDDEDDSDDKSPTSAQSKPQEKTWA